MSFKASRHVLQDTVNEFSQDRVTRLAAATAYYAAFSIGPLLVLIVGLAGLVWGQETVRREVNQQVQGFVGEQSAHVISSMMSAQKKGDTLVATIVGGVALIFGATGVFSQLQDSLNAIWGVTTKPGQSIGAYIRDRVFSMAMVLGIGFLLLVSLALSAFVNSFAHFIGSLISLPHWVVPALDGVASFLVIWLLFALIFKVLPDVRIRWRDVWTGAVGTAILFELGKYLLSLYLSREASSSAYGAGSSFVVILLYIYYSSVILYFGAEYTKIRAGKSGAQIRPSKYAVAMTDADRVHQGMPNQQQVENAARSAEAPRARPGPEPRHPPHPSDPEARQTK